jgi:phospholipid transport system substrate-binding protein
LRDTFPFLTWLVRAWVTIGASSRLISSNGSFNFTAFLENAYLNKLENYSGQKIAFVGETSASSGDSQVNTAVTQPNNNQQIRIDYLLKQDGGDWKVYDVTVDNISIMANYRNQFNRVINEQGFDALLKEMQSKQQDLVTSLGK